MSLTNTAIRNVKAAKKTAKLFDERGLRRSKTDAADAAALAEYSRSGLELRTLSRHIATLTEDHTRWGASWQGSTRR